MSELTKQCSKCREFKPISEYTFQDKEMNFRHSQCSDCKYWPKPKDGSCLRKCSDCNILKHYKDDFPCAQSCCKPCHALRKKLKVKPVEGESVAKPVVVEDTTDPIFTQGVCRIVLDGEEPTYQCKKCNEMRPLNYYTHKKANGVCKCCIRKLDAERMDSVHEFLNYKFTIAKNRASRDKIDFTITLKEWHYIYFVIQRGLCALCGLYMTHKKSGKTGPRTYMEFPYNISPDRKDSNKGYTFENVQFTRECLNIGKSDHSQEDYIQMCTDVVEYHKKPKIPHWTPEA